MNLLVWSPRCTLHACSGHRATVLSHSVWPFVRWKQLRWMISLCWKTTLACFWHFEETESWCSDSFYLSGLKYLLPWGDELHGERDLHPQQQEIVWTAWVNTEMSVLLGTGPLTVGSIWGTGLGPWPTQGHLGVFHKRVLSWKNHPIGRGQLGSQHMTPKAGKDQTPMLAEQLLCYKLWRPSYTVPNFILTITLYVRYCISQLSSRKWHGTDRFKTR